MHTASLTQEEIRLLDPDYVDTRVKELLRRGESVREFGPEWVALAKEVVELRKKALNLVKKYPVTHPSAASDKLGPAPCEIHVKEAVSSPRAMKKDADLEGDEQSPTAPRAKDNKNHARRQPKARSPVVGRRLRRRASQRVAQEARIGT